MRLNKSRMAGGLWRKESEGRRARMEGAAEQLQGDNQKRQMGANNASESKRKKPAIE